MGVIEFLIKRISYLCKEQGVLYYKLEELSEVNLSTIDNIEKGTKKSIDYGSNTINRLFKVLLSTFFICIKFAYLGILIEYMVLK